MSGVLRMGVGLVLVALVSYTIGVISEQRRRAISRSAFAFLAVGVFFDITATVFMIIGSGKLLSLHGLLGYSALAAMVTDTVLAWRHRATSGDGPTPRWLHLFTRFAYGWWLVAFISGGLLVAASRA